MSKLVVDWYSNMMYRNLWIQSSRWSGGTTHIQFKMSKGCVENPTIAIQPSPRLIDFIESLTDPSIEIPENLLHVYQGLTSDTRERNIERQSVPQPKLTIDDRILLRKLNSEESTVDLNNCLRNLALSAAVVDDPTTSIEILNEKTSNCINRTKCDQSATLAKTKIIPSLL